ncbi:MAG: hypothetical protein CL933_00805 [Deltaproteobacteria bacterium]|nr:hypothetical protein [Deltaproteobacteria bacterium]
MGRANAVRILAGTTAILLVLASIAFALLYAAGGGSFGRAVEGGEPTDQALPAAIVRKRETRQTQTAAEFEVFEPKQILFGDLHVHSSFSTDAFQLTLPTAGGEGIHPVADACDFARFCADLDFWSINDHANSITARRWRETIDTVRQCNQISAGRAVGEGDPDLVSFLGWEWTQMGSTPDNHYGHKNVILRDLAEGAIPARPIAAAPPPGVPSTFNTGDTGRLALGLGAFALERGHDMIRQLSEIRSMERCPAGVPVRELPLDCNEAVATPGELFAKLDEWGHAATVIPHGTVWGMYTPPGSSWKKQLSTEQHDAERQRLVEVYSGHGNAEEYRPWVAATIAANGDRSCPEPSLGYTPSCWQAGEIIRNRCLSANEGGADPIECQARAVEARQDFVEADRNAGPWTIPGLLPHELHVAGQCLDCFQPAFNYRPLGSVQYMLALGRPEAAPGARNFRFGLIASSDNHTARAGTGYKEVARRQFTDARMGEIGGTDLVMAHRRPSEPRSQSFPATATTPSVAFLEGERSGSYFLTGGLAAVHARSRERNEIFDALERRETYGTSGPRILLWFDLLDPKAPGGAWPMGSEVEQADIPTFRVRAAGSFEQKPGCPASTTDVLMPDRIATLCLGECYFPSDQRRPITRIEVVRIRTQRGAGDEIAPLIEDPWKTLACSGDPDGCQVVFSDPEFPAAGRDTSYYVRAIESASLVVDADPLGCASDLGSEGRCLELDPCFDRADDDECLALSEQRAWSSPIFVDLPRSTTGVD